MKYFFFTWLILCSQLIIAQNKMTINLNDVIKMAESRSIQSHVNKNNYLNKKHAYRIFQAKYLPSLTLNSNLLTYSNNNQLRFNSVTNTEDYFRTENLHSNARIQLSQNITKTGGRFYIESFLARNANLNNNQYIQFSSRPYLIGYQQNLFGFNAFKWEHKIEPKRFEQAKKQNNESSFQLQLTSSNYFFAFVLSDINLQIAKFNYSSSDTLFKIAQKRYSIGMINKDDLINLELKNNDYAINLEVAKINFRKNKESLLSFLRLPIDTKLQYQLPPLKNKSIIPTDILQKARNNNSIYITNELALLNTQRTIANAKANTRVQTNINMSYGINKVDGYFDYNQNKAINGQLKNMYANNFDQYQQISLSVSVPIINWGQNKGHLKIAISEHEITKMNNKQRVIDFESNVLNTALQFNLQDERVKAAKKSDELAQENFSLVTEQFKQGKIDILKINNAQNNQDNAKLQYIYALREYWSLYYQLCYIIADDL